MSKLSASAGVVAFSMVALTLAACSAADGANGDAIDQTGNDQQDLTARGFDSIGVDRTEAIGASEPDLAPAPDEAAHANVAASVTALACSHLQWWNSYITYSHMSYGWHDTDLSVRSSTAVQLRHASRLVHHGVYGWGYMPEFVDLVTGKRFRFLHLRPQHQLATVVGKVYPAGYIVGYSGGDTHDTGYPTYSTGAHLCVQTLSPYRACFPSGHDACR